MNMDKIICNCFNVSVQQIKEAIDNGAKSVEEVQDITGAGTGCGGCINELTDIVEEFLRK